MQNRKQHDLSLGEYISLQKSHTKLHDAQEIIQLSDLIEGPSFETMILGAVVDAKLEKVHAEMQSHNHEVKAVHEQLQRVAADVAAKKADIGNKIAERNGVRETFSKLQGVFASANKSASNSDTEEVSSLEVSPVTPRM